MQGAAFYSTHPRPSLENYNKRTPDWVHTEANKYLCGPRLCKKPNGEDWVLGTGGYGRVVKGVRGDVQVTLSTCMHCRMTLLIQTSAEKY